MGGFWSKVHYNWDVLAVHATVLPNGKVLAWDATPDDFDGLPHTNGIYTTRVTLWVPPTEFNKEGYHQRTDNNTKTDLFCSGSSQLWNGRVIFTGGDTGRHHLGGENANGPSKHANIYDYILNKWERLPDLLADRWYSANVALGSGRTLTIGGAYNPTPYAETLETDMQWNTQNYSAPNAPESGNYPGVVTYSGNGENDIVYKFLPHIKITKYDTKNGGFEIESFKRDIYYRDYGSFAMYNAIEGKVLIAGGGDTDNKPSYDSAIVLNLKDQNWNHTGSLKERRRQHNLTVDATLNVIATGGHKGQNTLIELDVNKQAKSAEIYQTDVNKPNMGQWLQMNSASISRQYHSIAILLPDGTILSAGGGYCGDCDLYGYYHQNAEIFYPPYLFNEVGELATRPKILSPNINQNDPERNFAVNYEQIFSLSTDQNEQIKKVTLIKLGSVTHSTNQEQRGMKLDFWSEGNALKVRAPRDRNIAPPGHYMLFVINQNGVPSVSEIIRVGQPLLTSGQSVKDRLHRGKTQNYEINMQDNIGLVINNDNPNVIIRAFVGSYPSETNNICINPNTQNCEINAGKWQKVFISASANLNYGESEDFTLTTNLLKNYAQNPGVIEEVIIEEQNNSLTKPGNTFIGNNLPWQIVNTPIGHCQLRSFEGLKKSELPTDQSLRIVLSGPSYTDENFCDQIDFENNNNNSETNQEDNESALGKDFLFDGTIWRVNAIDNNGQATQFCKYKDGNQHIGKTVQSPESQNINNVTLEIWNTFEGECP